MANNIFIDFLPPWIETGIQPAFYDKESGTVLQQTARMYAKVNEVIGEINHQNEVITDYIEQFNELHDYVYDYFDNLNVQTEINNKLDKMIVDGSFQPLLEIVFDKYYDLLKVYTDSQLDSKVDKDGVGQVTYNNLSQSVKEMFTGGNTAVVGTNSVTSANIADNSISYQKLNDNGKKGVAGYPQDRTLNFSWEQGKRDTSNDGSLVADSKTITCTEPFTFSLGMKITTAVGYKAHIYSWTGGSKTNYNSSYGALSHLIGTTTPDQDKEWYITIAKTDSSNIEPSEGVDSIFVVEHQTNVAPSYSATDVSLQRLLSGRSTSIKLIDSNNLGNAVQTSADFGYYKGSYTTSTNFTRAWLNTPIFLPAGANISVTNNWKFLIIKASTRMNTTKSYYPSAWGTELTVPEDDIYYFAYKKEDDADLGTTTASDFTDYLSISIPATSYSEKISYVSGIGNDSTGDGSAENPYRQITKALAVGSKIIICSPNYRYNDLNLSNLFNVKIVGAMPSYSVDSQTQLKPYFDNSIKLSSGTLENGKIKIAYTAEEGSDMYECLVAKNKDINDGVTRTYGYYCTIFSDGDKDTSHRYIPVLTQDDVEGHFYYDGTYIYINPYEDNTVSMDYLLVDKALQSQLSLVALNNCHNITFENFTFKHSSSSLLNLNQCTGIKVNNCDFCGSSMGDNLHAVDTDIDIEESVSYLARNDGFNFHGFGNSIVTKCVGCNCFDDGISHHDQCTHTIIGGEYYNNGKGGVASPTYGCSGDIIGVYTHNNPYGIYAVSDNSHGKLYINLNGNLIANNDVGINLKIAKGVCFNNILTGNNTNIVNNSDVVIY